MMTIRDLLIFTGKRGRCGRLSEGLKDLALLTLTFEKVVAQF